MKDVYIYSDFTVVFCIFFCKHLFRLRVIEKIKFFIRVLGYIDWKLNLDIMKR